MDFDCIILYLRAKIYSALNFSASLTLHRALNRLICLLRLKAIISKFIHVTFMGVLLLKRIILFLLPVFIIGSFSFAASAETLTFHKNLALALQSADMFDSDDNTITAIIVIFARIPLDSAIGRKRAISPFFSLIS